jgi:PilZ domain
MQRTQSLDRAQEAAVDETTIREPDRSEKEQRRHVRKRVLWAGKIATKDGSFDCVVLNVSRSGAKLRFTAPIGPQRTVDLSLGSFGTLNAEVVWQRADKMGIRFTADPDQVANIIGEALTL